MNGCIPIWSKEPWYKHSVQKKPIGQPVSFEDAGDLGDEGIVRVGVTEQGADREQNLKSKELKNTWPDRGVHALQSITSHQLYLIRWALLG